MGSLAAEAAAAPGAAAARAANPAQPGGAAALGGEAALPRRPRLGPALRVPLREAMREITPAPSSAFYTVVEAGQTGGRFEDGGVAGQGFDGIWAFPGCGVGDATPHWGTTPGAGLGVTCRRTSTDGAGGQAEELVRSVLGYGRTDPNVSGPVAVGA